MENNTDPNQVNVDKITFTPNDTEIIRQPLCIAPGQQIVVKYTVIDTYEREALRLLLERDYIVYKKTCGRASLD